MKSSIYKARVSSSYILFQEEFRKQHKYDPAFKKSSNNKFDTQKFSKFCGNKWNSLSQNETKPYTMLSKALYYLQKERI